MGNARARVKVVKYKRFYRPKELAKITGIDEEKLIRFAYVAGAIYDVKSIRLIKWAKMRQFLADFDYFISAAEGEYMLTSEIVKAIGLGDDITLRLVANARAAYRVGRYTFVNVQELRDYIAKLKIEMEPVEVPEVNRKRGTKFV